MNTVLPGSKQILNIPLNRVEGDLEIRVEVSNGKVQDAWSAGMMYRGFENLLLGRAPLDSLVITPRICGICSTAHLTAAVRALEGLSGITPPKNARRARNLSLMVEHLQSDMRHAFLHFAPDFANPAYAHQSFFDEARRRYQPLQGQMAVETIRQTRQVLEIIAILGGQWPHSSFMVPGGITLVPPTTDLLRCRYLLSEFRHWYEDRVLGCSLERWLAVDSPAALEEWLQEKEAHRAGEIGFFLQCARALNLDQLGKGPGNFLCSAGMENSDDPSEQAFFPSGVLLTGAAASGQRMGIQPFDQAQISEHVAHSWFVDDGPRHPFEGMTRPEIDTQNNRPYSWAKAPRYADLPVETGPLATALVGGDPLLSGLVRQAQGPNVLIRQLARLTRPARYLTQMDAWLAELVGDTGPYYHPIPDIVDAFNQLEGSALGMAEASRGALGHWVKVQSGRISSYQIITPTAWNGSPRDNHGRRGPWEEALIDAPVADTDDPLAVGHIIRSFDACLVCTVHTIKR